MFLNIMFKMWKTQMFTNVEIPKLDEGTQQEYYSCVVKVLQLL